MPSPIFVGQYVYYFDFPNQVDLDFYPPAPREIFPTITSEEDIYTVECDRFSEYVKKIKVQCDDKMTWVMSAAPTVLDSLEDVISPRQLCDYLNTSDYWKKNGDWPSQINEEHVRAFNIEVLKTWLFQKTAGYFYAQNPDILPSLNEYKKQQSINLEQFKQEILALDALYLMKSNLNSYLVGSLGQL